MLKTLITILGIGLSATAMAQTVSHATFYSPDGLRFIIYLNGQQMNSEPQTEVRCINLTQPYYSAKAVFEDPTLAPAERKMLQLTDAHHNRVDATFVLEKNRNGEMKIGWKSQTLYPQFISEERTPTVVVVGGGTGVQQTTTTRTVTQAQPEGVSMSFGGLGGHVSVNTGGSGQAVIEETTTTTTAAPAANSGKELPCSGTILGTDDFDEALQTVRMRSTEDGRLQSGKMLVTTNCITTEQLKKIGFLLETEQAHLDLAIFAYPYTLDKGNYFKMNALFTLEASIDALNNAIIGK